MPQKRRRAAAKAKPSKESEPEKKNEEETEKMNKKRVVKPCKMAKRLRKRTEVEDLPFESANVKRNASGRKVIEQKMVLLKTNDAEVYPNLPLFSGDPQVCKLKCGKCEGMPWTQILDSSYPFLKAEFLSVVQLSWVFIFWLKQDQINSKNIRGI